MFIKKKTITKSNINCQIRSKNSQIRSKNSQIRSKNYCRKCGQFISIPLPLPLPPPRAEMTCEMTSNRYHEK